MLVDRQLPWKQQVARKLGHRHCIKSPRTPQHGLQFLFEISEFSVISPLLPLATKYTSWKFWVSLFLFRFFSNFIKFSNNFSKRSMKIYEVFGATKIPKFWPKTKLKTRAPQHLPFILSHQTNACRIDALRMKQALLPCHISCRVVVVPLIEA